MKKLTIFILALILAGPGLTGCHTMGEWTGEAADEVEEGAEEFEEGYEERKD